MYEKQIRSLTKKVAFLLDLKSIRYILLEVTSKALSYK
jgi:hypothetical protein